MFTIVKVEFGVVIDYHFKSCETIEQAVEEVRKLNDENYGFDYLIYID